LEPVEDADNPVLPPEGDRRTFIVAETRAGMFAYTMLPTAVSGLYTLIDIGAGTTDMSIFRYVAEKELPGYKQPHFYNAAIYPAGADRVDQIILSGLPRGLGGVPRSEWLGRVRIAKQEDEDGRKARRAIGNDVPAEVYERASATVGGELFAQYKKVLTKAYGKEPKVDRWQEVTMFLIGGGSNLHGVEEALAASPWPPFLPPPEVRPLKLPDDMPCNGSDPARDSIAHHERLLLVAYGLSFPYAALADYTMPDSVESLEPPDPPPIPDGDDYGKEGQWW
jgi:hypothetical protein